MIHYAFQGPRGRVGISISFGGFSFKKILCGRRSRDFPSEHNKLVQGFWNGQRIALSPSQKR